ncbi:Abi family protein [Limosilactobacillus equigenerosi]|uniref:Abi family protein n=1 Tax=Limosilactobacillus equigenerosi TaxID=417373 RepID=UPI000ACEDCE1|nr:Abi family protein [Limosilactobacillus equigenerosi]
MLLNHTTTLEKLNLSKKESLLANVNFCSKKLNKTYNSKANPIKYYREKYGNVPPWIIVKGLTFGESIYWYKLSKPNIRVKIISRMFGLNPEIIDAADKDLKIKQLFGDLLSLYLTYRNQCAHGGRIYNHRSKKTWVKELVAIFILF